jgi:hypothetical protein
LDLPSEAEQAEQEPARFLQRHPPPLIVDEVTFENSKQLLGLEDAANRTEKAVRRTAPMALVLYSLIVLWFHQVGHRHVQYPDRPWYFHKEEPSFADMLTTLRRLSWQDKLREPQRTGSWSRPGPVLDRVWGRPGGLLGASCVAKPQKDRRISDVFNRKKFFSAPERSR